MQDEQIMELTDSKRSGNLIQEIRDGDEWINKR